MEKESKEGRENGGENDTNDTKEEENTQTADNEVADKCGVELDTGNDVAPIVDDDMETDSCQGPEAVSGAKTTSEKPSGTVSSGNGSVQLKKDPEFQEKTRGEDTKAAVSGAKTTSEKPSGTVPSGNGSVQPKTDPESQEDTRCMKTKADEEVKKPYDEAQNATEDKNIAQGKTDKINASNLEEQSDPDSSPADPGTNQVEPSRTVRYQDGGPPKTAADSPSELAGNKGIKEPSNKTPDAPTAQSIKRNNMEDSSSNGTPEALPGSVVPEAGLDPHAEGDPEKRTNEQKVSKEGAAATDGSTKQDGTTKQKDNDEQVEAGSTEHPTEETKEPSVHINKGQGLVSFRPSDTTANTSQRVMKEILTDIFLLSLSKRINLKNVPAESLSVYLGFSAADGAAAVIGIKSTKNPPSALNTLLSKFVMINGRKSESALNLRKRFLENGMKDSADVIKAELDKFNIPVPSDEETLVNTPVIIPYTPVGRPVLRNPTTNPTTPNRNSGSKDPKDKEGARERKTKEKSEEEKRALTGGSTTFGRPVLRNPTTNPTTPDRIGSKDSKDKEGDRERKTEEESEEERRATENKANEQKVSKEGAAATKDATEKDETTKQKANEKKVEAGGTGHSTEGAEEPFDHINKERPVYISVCTSAYDSNVQGLVSFLKDLKEHHPKLIEEVKIHTIPYNDLDHYKFPKENPVDVMLLCHSINNRRFAITDVMDALYDEYLPYCARVVGKEKMGVIVHDFDDMRETVQASRMGSFSYKQPKAFETTSLQIICGHIEKKEQVLNQMQKADREKVLEFLKNASRFPEQKKEDVNADPGLLTFSKEKYYKYKAQLSSYISSPLESNTQQGCTHDESSVDPVEAEVKAACRHLTADDSQKISGSQTTKRFGNEHSCQKTKRLYLPGTPGVFHQTPQASMYERNLNPPREASPIGQQRPGTSNTAASAHTRGSHRQQPMTSRRTVTSAPQRSHTTSSPRRISISVCSSAYEHNVKRFMSKLTELQIGQQHIADVRFRSLPYNDIDSFRFPPNDPVDVMVLCHSVQNRGFSITNVLNALYEKHLQYCYDVIGKKKLAVIVHDFSDCQPKILDARMEAFRRSQSLTFELVDTVIVCGSLEKPGKIEMRDEDMTRLTTFFERARYEPKENYADEKSVMKIVRGFFNI